MGRIRSIKPETPQSQSFGRLSRDARLLFIQLWTFVDDEGRARGVSRMLASLLYPYDDDAPSLIEGWLQELEREDCIQRYDVDGSTYLQVTNWLIHQKIDKPSKSKIPPQNTNSPKPREPSRKVAPDLGSRTLDLESKEPAADASRETVKSAITQEAFDLRDRLLIIQKLDPHDPTVAIGTAYHVQAWLTKGWDAAAIVQGVETVMARQQGPPRSIRYFEPAIAQVIADRNRPLPVAVPSPVSNVHAFGGKNGHFQAPRNIGLHAMARMLEESADADDRARSDSGRSGFAGRLLDGN